MRPACALCALKHIAQACVLALEASKGYPAHHWLALGHLAEAEDELVAKYPGLADNIRKVRKELESSPRAPVDFISLLQYTAQSTGYDVPPGPGEEAAV